MATIDDALTILDRHGPEYGRFGFSNHGPMAAEALLTLGRNGAVIPWLERYVRLLGDPPPPVAPIPPGEWRAALGADGRVTDWLAFFQRELSEAPFAGVLARWVPRLASGIRAAATHGVMRTAHAARSLDDGVNPPRLAELAGGLAYWASRYALLPGTPAPAPARYPSHALPDVHRPPLPSRDGSIDDRMSHVAGAPGFRDAINIAAPGADPSAFLSDLTAAMARLYLANVAHGASHDIAFVHAVTGPSALRLLAPHLTGADHILALRYAWQAAAAIYAAYSAVDFPAAPPQDEASVIMPLTQGRCGVALQQPGQRAHLPRHPAAHRAHGGAALPGSGCLSS